MALRTILNSRRSSSYRDVLDVEAVPYHPMISSKVREPLSGSRTRCLIRFDACWNVVRQMQGSFSVNNLVSKVLQQFLDRTTSALQCRQNL